MKTKEIKGKKKTVRRSGDSEHRGESSGKTNKQESSENY